MPWFKVDDNLALHAKVSAAGNSAMGLWVRAGSWCAQQLTDGHVPLGIVLTFGTKQQAERLVRAGLWEVDEGGYRFWQWGERQPTRAQVEAEREAARERMRSRRRPSRGTGSGDVQANTERSSAEVRKPRPDPTRPDPSRTPSEFPGEASGGSSPQVTRAAPAPRCPAHQSTPAPGPCGACGDARRAREQWDREEQQRRRDAGPVVGGHHCPDHPHQPAARCPECTRTAVPMPVDLRSRFRRSS